MPPAALALKLDPLIRRLATDHDGERLATLAALERVLRASGFAFHDLAGCVIASAEPLSVRDPTPFQPVPHAFIAVDALFDCSGLTAWEVNFLHSVGRQLCRHRRLTDKQHAALDRLWGKYQGRARMSAKVEVIEVRPVSNAGNLKALVTIKAGCFNIRGWRVIQQPGQRAWVSVPQEQGSDGRWHNRLEVTNPEVLEAIRRAILQAWEGRNEPRGLLSGRGRLRRAAIVERLSLCRESACH